MIRVTNQMMIVMLVNKVIEPLLVGFDNRIAIEENEEVKRGLMIARSMLIEYCKSAGG